MDNPMRALALEIERQIINPTIIINSSLQNPTHKTPTPTPPQVTPNQATTYPWPTPCPSPCSPFTKSIKNPIQKSPPILYTDISPMPIISIIHWRRNLFCVGPVPRWFCPRWWESKKRLLWSCLAFCIMLWRVGLDWQNFLKDGKVKIL